ncbi:MAG: radical SAM protein [Candidatus Thorarchaeota archaeon]
MALDDVEGYYYNQTMREYFDTVRLYALQLEINTDCGQSCRFCYVRRTVGPGRRLPREFVMSVLDQAANLEVKTIEWLGGDPLRHPDFWDMLSFSRSLGLTNNIWSTGDLLTDPRLIEFLLDDDAHGIVSFHLDTLDPSVYRQLSSTSPEFVSRVLSNVQELIRQGVQPERLYNCMTFTRLQAGNDFRNTVRTLSENYGVITGIVPYKHVVDDPSLVHLVPTAEEIRDALSFRNTLIYGGRLPITPQCVSKFYCGTTCSLTVNRELTPCTRIRYAVNRVSGDDFLTPFRESRSLLLKESMRRSEHLSDQCRNCRYSPVCWGCRGNAWYYGGDFLGSDPKCWYLSTQHSPSLDT